MLLREGLGAWVGEGWGYLGPRNPARRVHPQSDAIEARRGVFTLEPPTTGTTTSLNQGAQPKPTRSHLEPLTQLAHTEGTKLRAP